jgi:WD40 repeat protein
VIFNSGSVCVVIAATLSTAVRFSVYSYATFTSSCSVEATIQALTNAASLPHCCNCTQHYTQVNTVHVNPSQLHMFATASLDATVALWDARMMGGTKVPKVCMHTLHMQMYMYTRHCVTLYMIVYSSTTCVYTGLCAAKHTECVTHSERILGMFTAPQCSIVHHLAYSYVALLLLL